MPGSRLPFITLALVCAALGAYLASISKDEARLGRASADLVAGRSSEALAELDGLGGEAGRRAAALRAYAYLKTGQLTRSRAEFRAAVRRDPNNWLLQRDFATVLLGLGERSRARARVRKALALNPRMPLPLGFEGAK